MSNILSKDFYACQYKVPQFGEAGQSKLAQVKCLIIGMGGLGCPASLYLASSGVGHIGICDSDTVDVSNINRQILYTLEDVGEKKVSVAKEKLIRQNPYVTIQAYDTRINESNWKDIIRDYDIVLDCSDNFYSKFLIHDACYILKKNLIQAGVFQTSGQVYYFPFAENNKDRPCLRCIWDDVPGIVNQVDCKMAGVLSVVVGTVGLQQAGLAMLSLLKKAENITTTQLYDWGTLQWMNIEGSKKPDCMCSSEEKREHDTSYLYLAPIETTELPQKNNSGNTVLFDVRNKQDQHINTAFEGREVLSLPARGLLDFEEHIKTLSKEQEYVLVCYKGIRSLDLARRMRNKGYKAYSLLGGYTGL